MTATIIQHPNSILANPRSPYHYRINGYDVWKDVNKRRWRVARFGSDGEAIEVETFATARSAFQHARSHVPQDIADNPPATVLVLHPALISSRVA